MDYCSSCRRHLNGALVCPGCGAYAPDIAPATVAGRPVPARATAAPKGAAVSAATAWELTAPETLHDGRPRPEELVAVGGGEAPEADGAVDPDNVPPVPQGRAARRRQMARWKKNQRRAVVATAVALVGGGLTLASMDRHSGDRAQASTAPDVATMGAGEKQATQPTVPSPARPGTHRSSRTPATQSPATHLPSRRSAATAPSSTPPSARPDAAAVPRTTTYMASAASAPQTAHAAGAPAAPVPQPTVSSPSTGGTGSGGSGTATQQPSAPAAGNGTGAGSSQTSPAATATSPAHLCLLVVCLG
ncbi:hypothetical protein [Streptomyces sp. TP-A0356]|uniref:SCO2400 family protein n=1 Tax=Streptomyces sp. TP-A0356 TaxID=1359208 RepID=UPI0006E1C0B2|nr:hypothetical protein [Streptomyces sp. TP-A0356]